MAIHAVRLMRPLVVVLVVMLALSACGGDNPTPSSGKMTVFAASSLKEAFTKVGGDFKAGAGGSEVEYNFAGSQDLVTQLKGGAKADVFASADKKNMDAAVSAGLIDGDAQKLLTNKLVVIIPSKNPANISSLKDLARAGVKLDLADTSVPVGNYSQQVLDKLSADPAYGSDFKAKVNANVISKEDNVKAVVAKVQLGEADAGIVYTTDAAATQRATPVANIGPVQTIAIPDQVNVIAVYYIGKVKGSPNPTAATAFIAYVLGSEGQKTLADFGFGPNK